MHLLLYIISDRFYQTGENVKRDLEPFSPDIAVKMQFRRVRVNATNAERASFHTKYY